MNKLLLGIDIAKDTLELALIDQHSGQLKLQRSLANTAADHQALIRLLTRTKRHGAQVQVIMEATGTYHLRLLQALDKAQIDCSVINPLQLKRFAQMKMLRLKSDRSDARLLAHYGRQQQPALHQQQPAVQQQLKQLNTLIAQLTKQRTALQNLLHATAQIPSPVALCEQLLGRQIKQLTAALAQLRAEQERLAGSAYDAERSLIESVPGVGPRTALAVLAYLGDLGRFSSHKQVAAYLGLNPVVQQSGTSLRGRGSISKQGHAGLRTLFYLCALSAKRHNRVCRLLYTRLKAAGKPEKVALVAVANKLIKQVFTVVKTGVRFDDDYVPKRGVAA